jgi:hypothetical protein
MCAIKMHVGNPCVNKLIWTGAIHGAKEWAGGFSQGCGSSISYGAKGTRKSGPGTADASTAA